MRSGPKSSQTTGWRVLLAGLMPVFVGLVIAGCTSHPSDSTLGTYDVNRGLSAVSVTDSVVSSLSEGGRPLTGTMSTSVGNVTFAENAVPVSTQAFSVPLDFGNGIVSTFHFPDGTINRTAFPNDTVITIQGWMHETHAGNVFIYRCGPHGHVFKNDIYLYQPVSSGLHYKDLGLFYYDDDGFIWELEAISRASDSRAIFKILHFSKYGVS